MNPEENPTIGYIVSGSLKNNLQVRLTRPPQEVQEGSFVVVQSGDWQFYGLVTDLQLGSTDPRFADEQSEVRLPGHLAHLLHGQTLYTNLEVLPALMLEVGPDPAVDLRGYELWRASHPEDQFRALPVKTVPSHHAPVRMASAGDVAEIFGKPEKPGMFVLGHTREQQHPVCINLDKLVQRSSGIFGATGTGKSFLTRIILAGLIHHGKTGVLVFDMHNEYAYDDIASDTRQQVPGLKGKFGSKVRVAALGARSTIRGNSPDFTLEVAESDITPGDIEMLTLELNLRETTPATLEALYHDYGPREWFRRFREMKVGAVVEDEDGKKVPAPDSVAFWANRAGVNVAAAEALHNKLGRVFNKPYIVANPAADTISAIIDSLAHDKHVVLSFGEYETDLDYLLVTNLLTRRIRAEWEKRTNDFRAHGKQEPRPLVIAVEEAHKLLNREMAGQTAFSTIAREMRKYYVTLLIIDQRPSQIYDEVMSQLGTRISGWLGDEADIHAVLSGLAGRDLLRGMLSRLQPKEEVLVLGQAVPMPIPLRSRRYDDNFWRDLLGSVGPRLRSLEQNLSELGY
jgi:DNA helicase HerA-like ATPase